MWDLPGPGLEPVSPALAGRFSTTAPPGKPYSSFSKELKKKKRPGGDFGHRYPAPRDTECLTLSEFLVRMGLLKLKGSPSLLEGCHSPGVPDPLEARAGALPSPQWPGDRGLWPEKAFIFTVSLRYSPK